jgi:diamine N-acetyltransferase
VVALNAPPERIAMSVTLREITAETVRDVVKLSVAPEQSQFVAPNAVSLAEALFSKEAWYRAAYADDALAGFVMLYDESQRDPRPANPNIGLWRLMVDHRFQGRGVGRAIVLKVIEHVRAKGCFTSLFTSYVPAPGGPAVFYEKLGFVPNGEVDNGEIVMVFDLNGGSA